MGTSKNRHTKRLGIKSNSKKIPGGLEWGEYDRNHSTMKKIEKATQEEKEEGLK